MEEFGDVPAEGNFEQRSCDANVIGVAVTRFEPRQNDILDLCDMRRCVQGIAPVWRETWDRRLCCSCGRRWFPFVAGGIIGKQPIHVRRHEIAKSRRAFLIELHGAGPGVVFDFDELPAFGRRPDARIATRPLPALRLPISPHHELPHPIKAAIAVTGVLQSLICSSARSWAFWRLYRAVGELDPARPAKYGAGPMASITVAGIRLATLIILETAALSIPSAAMMMSRL